MGILIIPIVLLGFYFLILRPQQKQLREQQELLASIEEGDEIRTNSGIYGTIVAIDGEQMLVEIADGVEVQMHKAAVAELVEWDDGEGDESSDELADETDDEA